MSMEYQGCSDCKWGKKIIPVSIEIATDLHGIEQPGKHDPIFSCEHCKYVKSIDKKNYFYCFCKRYKNIQPLDLAKECPFYESNHTLSYDAVLLGGRWLSRFVHSNQNKGIAYFNSQCRIQLAIEFLTSENRNIPLTAENIAAFARDFDYRLPKAYMKYLHYNKQSPCHTVADLTSKDLCNWKCHFDITKRGLDDNAIELRQKAIIAAKGHTYYD